MVHKNESDDMMTELKVMKNVLEYSLKINNNAGGNESNGPIQIIMESAVSIFSIGFFANSFKLMYDTCYKNISKPTLPLSLSLSINNLDKSNVTFSGLPTPTSSGTKPTLSDLSGVIVSTLCGVSLCILTKWISRKQPTIINGCTGCPISLIREIDDLMKKVDDVNIQKDAPDYKTFNKIKEKYNKIVNL